MEHGVVEAVPATRRREWLLTAALAVVPALHALVALLVRPMMFSDSGWGFLVLQSMKNGAGFNNLVGPNPLDIATDSSHFLTWWSPGQYLVPGLFELLGADLGAAMVLTSAVFSALGALGWREVYRSLGFSFATIAIATLAIVTARWFALPFGIYNGGEVLLFGVAPWVVLLFWRLRDLSVLSLPALSGAMLVLTGAKLTGGILGFSLLGSCLLFGGNRRSPRRWMVAIGVSSVFGALFLAEWLAKGPAPGLAPGRSWVLTPLAFVFPVFAAVSSTLGLGDLLSWLLMHPSRPVLTSLGLVYMALAPMAGLMLWFVWRRLQRSSPEYVRFSIAAAALFSVAYFLLSAHGGASFEERHFRSIGLLLFAGVVQVFAWHRSRLVRLAFFAALVTMSLYGLGSTISHARHNLESPMGAQGFRHGIATASVLNFMKEEVGDAGERGRRAVVYVPSPEIGLELEGSRVIAAQPDFESVASLTSRKFLGRARAIYVLVQKDLVENGKAELILRSFKDYELAEWEAMDLGDFTCYSQLHS